MTSHGLSHSGKLLLWLAVVVLGRIVSVNATTIPARPQTVAQGITFTVSVSAIDEYDAAPGDGICHSFPSGICTLRAAVMETNALPGPDTIILEGKIYPLTRSGEDDTALDGDLDITDDLTLIGIPQGVTRIRNENDMVHDRILETVGPVNVLIVGVMFQNGQALQHGGALYNGPKSSLTLDHVVVGYNRVLEPGDYGGYGGGIYNAGELALIDSNVYGNGGPVHGAGLYNASQAVLDVRQSTIQCNESSYAFASGGGLDNAGTVTIDRSTISSNTADIGGGLVSFGGIITMTNSTVSGNMATLGGGIYAYGNTRIRIINSTISGNHAGSWGGGIYNLADLSLSSSTVAFNQADSDNNGSGLGGGIANSFDGVLTLRNSLVVNNKLERGIFDAYEDCAGTIASAGYNMLRAIPATTCHLVGSMANYVTVDPRIGALAGNGGPTWTHALLGGSPAIDAAAPSGCGDEQQALIAGDQRDYGRPADGDGDGQSRCDIGAYEFGAAPLPTPTPTPTPTASPTPQTAYFVYFPFARR